MGWGGDDLESTRTNSLRQCCAANVYTENYVYSYVGALGVVAISERSFSLRWRAVASGMCAHNCGDPTQKARTATVTATAAAIACAHALNAGEIIISIRLPNYN